MTNPSANPQTSVPESPIPSTGTGVLFAGVICSSFAAIVTTIIGLYVIPQFSQVFANFGAELPLITRFVISYYWLIWLLPILAFCTWRFWPNNRRRNVVIGIICIVTPVLVVPTIVIAMYLPIYSLEATV